MIPIELEYENRMSVVGTVVLPNEKIKIVCNTLFCFAKGKVTMFRSSKKPRSFENGTVINACSLDMRKSEKVS